MTKKILIAVPTLNSGGVEVSLIRFLNEFSKNKDVSIDLLMLEKTGIYLKSVPKKVNIMEVEYTNSMYNYCNKIHDVKKYKKFFDKIKYMAVRVRLRYLLNRNKWEEYYHILLSHVVPVTKEYDLAIDWHGYGHFITTVVAEKVVAKKKAMWLHDEKNDWLDKISYWQNNFDKIFCVGKSVMNKAIERKPELKERCDVFYNMIDYQDIIKKSQMISDVGFDKKNTNIVTVGRLEWQKGYDIALEIALELKKQNFSFCWYVIGSGTKERELKSLVKEKKLTDSFIFLGMLPNPFPYIKNADFYLQPSRHEGYGLAIAEARVLGTIPISTDLDCVKEQIEDGKNGFLCKLNPKDFAHKIIEVSNDKELRNKVINNLKKDKFDYTSEFLKLYKLMEE